MVEYYQNISNALLMAGPPSQAKSMGRLDIVGVGVCNALCSRHHCCHYQQERWIGADADSGFCHLQHDGASVQYHWLQRKRSVFNLDAMVS